MPELFAAFGMTNAGATMLDFVANYLYGFILIAIPMLCLVLIAVRLVARYVDRGSMAYLLATPNTRGTIVTTQLFFILLCTFFLVGYATALGLIASNLLFPGELDVFNYLRMNVGLLQKCHIIRKGHSSPKSVFLFECPAKTAVICLVLIKFFHFQLRFVHRHISKHMI